MTAVSAAERGRTPSPGDDEAIVSASVVPDRGRWAVVLDVVFPDGAVRHDVTTYHTREKAELAARLMKAAAERRPGGIGGP
ncbi:MAG TPA: hypothetical protein VII98_12950 [Solirubrobacteraceae bacterium]